MSHVSFGYMHVCVCDFFDFLNIFWPTFFFLFKIFLIQKKLESGVHFGAIKMFFFSLTLRVCSYISSFG